MGRAPDVGTFEQRYLEIRKQLFVAHWDLYAQGRSARLGGVSAAMYELANEVTSRNLPAGRRSDILIRVLTRELVDAHPEVSALVNRITTGRGDQSDGEESIAAAALAAESDVVEVMRLRNALARTHGADDYAHFVMTLVGLDLSRVRALVDDIHRDSLLAVRRGSRGTSQIHHDRRRTPGASETPAEGPVEAGRLLAALGLADLAPRISWHVADHGFPYDCPVSVPDDIRVLLPKTNTLDQLTGVFHELGHAVMHVANEQSGMLTTWNELWDESMAMTMQRIGTTLRFDAETADALRRVEDRERLRLSTSFLFELDVIADPGRARELFTRWYEPLGRVERPAEWALDTFRVEDPVHVYTFVVGEIVADAVIHFLLDRFGRDYQHWGPWLRAHFYAEGRAATLFDKLGVLGDHRPRVVACLAL